MDDEAHGIEATVIDLGLARMETSDGDSRETHWTPFEEEIFEGEGKAPPLPRRVPQLTHTRKATTSSTCTA